MKLNPFTVTVGVICASPARKVPTIGLLVLMMINGEVEVVKLLGEHHVQYWAVERDDAAGHLKLVIADVGQLDIVANVVCRQSEGGDERQHARGGDDAFAADKRGVLSVEYGGRANKVMFPSIVPSPPR